MGGEGGLERENEREGEGSRIPILTSEIPL